MESTFYKEWECVNVRQASSNLAYSCSLDLTLIEHLPVTF